LAVECRTILPLYFVDNGLAPGELFIFTNLKTATFWRFYVFDFVAIGFAIALAITSAHWNKPGQHFVHASRIVDIVASLCVFIFPAIVGQSASAFLPIYRTCFCELDFPKSETVWLRFLPGRSVLAIAFVIS
jgi:hypothetical protein